VGIKAHKTYHHFQETFAAVQEAVQQQCRIDIQYFTMSRNASSFRRIAPYQVWFYDETFYVIGYCESRKEIRLFAIDRIESISLLDDRFEIPDGFDADAFMHMSFGVFQGEPVKVSIRFGPQAAGYIKEKIWHPSQILEPQSDGAVVFTAEVAGIEEIKRWIMKWGSAAHVLEPASLRNEIAGEARKMLQYYDAIT
jgi:predicted DNA-binding transcriptional regulator YafY